jgi:tetratricopeptide (TPR) repeat protein
VVEQSLELNRGWLAQAAESTLAVALLRLGELDEAWVRERWDGLDSEWNASQMVIPTAEILLARGDLQGALDRLDLADEVVNRMNLNTRRGGVAEARSRALLRLGRAEEARDAAESVLALVEEKGCRPLHWRLLAARGAALAALGQQDAAASDRAAAAEIVWELAASIDDEALRAGFLAQPEVQTIVSA